jgi:hypothetical protein
MFPAFLHDPPFLRKLRARGGRFEPPVLFALYREAITELSNPRSLPSEGREQSEQNRPRKMGRIKTMTNPTATIPEFIPDGARSELRVMSPDCAWVLALVLSFAVFALNRSALASEPTLLAQAPKSQDVMTTNGAGPCQVAKQYVSLINKGQYSGLGGLFADNAVYQGPDGKTRHGSKEIGEFYVKMLTRLRPHMKPASFIEQGSECVMELENKDSKERYVLTAIDHFTVDPNGKATHFVVYFRPGAPLPNLKDIGK